MKLENSPFDFNEQKCLASLLHILKVLNRSSQKHELFKILYFADKLHLSKFGRPIVGDNYFAMKYGPVPSLLYDLIKHKTPIILENLAINSEMIDALKEPDYDELSESDLECLNQAIDDNKDLNFEELTQKSHDNAYKMIYVEGTSKKMSYLDILTYNENVDNSLLEYVKESMEIGQIN
jgi:uncharacterized phage-associated protein